MVQILLDSKISLHYLAPELKFFKLNAGQDTILLTLQKVGMSPATFVFTFWLILNLNIF